MSENLKTKDVFTSLAESCSKDCEAINATLAFWCSDVRFRCTDDDIPTLVIDDDSLPF